MSQEKVNQYKEEKANRKQMIAKKKREKAIKKTVGAVVVVVLIGWVGYSAVETYQDSRPREMVEIDYTAVQDYLQSIAE